MNEEQRQAYAWAKGHDYPSVAARYARALAGAVDDLSAQLAESQRRELAAVEDMHEAALEQTGIGLCVICKWGPEEESDGPHCGKCTAGDCKFEWRDPQEAGKGEIE